MSLLRSAVLSLCMCSLLAACGGKVVFQEDGGSGGEGGTGAAGPGGPGPGGPGPGPNSSSGALMSTSTGMQMTACQQVCAQFPDCFDPGGGDCLPQCQELYVPGCEQQADALLFCLLGVLEPGCGFPEEACFEQSQAYGECQGSGDCSTDFCDSFDGGCECFGECFGLPLQEQCFTAFGPGGNPGPPPPLVTCDCFTNGDYLGTCEMDELLCDPDAGCCKWFLIQDG